MKVIGVSEKGQVRANNEDSFYCSQDNQLLIVADGMGGHVGGEVASAISVRTIVSFFDSQPVSAQTLTQAFTQANEAVYNYAASHPDLKGMGTTLTAVSVLDQQLLVGHIGDSRACLLDNNGLEWITSDHSVSGQLLEMGKISHSEAETHPQRHVLTQVLGTEAAIEPDVFNIPWQPGQFLLLCTDGLSDVVNEQEIHSAVMADSDLDIKKDRLLKLVAHRGAPDNVTFILAEL